MQTLKLTAAVLGIVLVTGSVHANIIVQDLYHLGESDSPTAIAGGAGDTTTVDSAGTTNLTKVASPLYSNIGGTAGSALSMSLDGSSAYMANSSVLTSTSSNFGMEVMVDPTVAGENAYLLYNGNGGNGYGILLQGGRATLLYGNQDIFTAGPVLPLNQWSEIAITRITGGNGENLYVNDALVMSANNNSANLPTGGVEIGESFSGTSKFTGLLDEARIFTFSTGQFSTSDLQVPAPIPEPASLGLFGACGLMLLRRRRTIR